MRACPFDTEYLNNMFIDHPPKGDQDERYHEVRQKAREMAEVISRLCGNNYEGGKAIDRLRESMMWTNAGIACNEIGVDE